jgi:hypothetical protein
MAYLPFLAHWQVQVEERCAHTGRSWNGFYVLMFKWLPGHMSRLHWHPHDRMITVFKGTWWVGTGDNFDPEGTVPLPVCSYVTHSGKEIHWDGAKNEEVWLLMALARAQPPRRLRPSRRLYSSARRLRPSRPETARDVNVGPTA